MTTMTTMTDTETTPAALIGRDYHIFEALDERVMFSVDHSQVIQIADELLYQTLYDFERQPGPATTTPEELVESRTLSAQARQELLDVLREIAPFTRRPADAPAFEPPAEWHPGKMWISSLTLLVSEACNLRCKYCYTGLQEQGLIPSRLMSEEVAKASIDFLIQHAPPGQTLGVTFFGGEPLLNMPVIAMTARYFTEKARAVGKKPMFSMTTNGMLLDEPRMRFLARIGCHVVLSIDGPAHIHDHNRIRADGSGTHEQVMQALELVRKYQKKPSVRATVDTTREGYLSTLELRQYFEALGVNDLSIAAVMPTVETDSAGTFTYERADEKRFVSDTTESMLDSYDRRMADQDHPYDQVHLSFRMLNSRHQLKFEKNCGACRSQTAVDADGVLYPCHRFWPMKAYAIGDVFRGYDHERYNRVLADYYKAVLPTCSKCWARFLCYTACMRYRVPRAEDGNFNAPDPRLCGTALRRWETDCVLFARATRDHPDKLKKLCTWKEDAQFVEDT